MTQFNSNNAVVVNKSQIIDELTRSQRGAAAFSSRDGAPTLPRDVVNNSVKVILDTVSNALREGRRVEIRGFGTFSVHQRKSCIARNPRTGETAYVNAKHVPHFKPGKRLRGLVNQQNTVHK